jgi:alanine racemase
MSQAQASVDLGAIQRNCERLRRELRDGVALCAVVKADGYGHGMLPAAAATQAGGATWLAVANLDEARALVGASDARVLVMGPIRAADLEEAVALDVDLAVWGESHLRQIAQLGGGRVHVKLDSGMGRLGTRDAEHATRVAAFAAATPGIELVGAMTHFATADEPDGGEFLAEQLGRFERWASALKRDHPELLVHAANSAATLREPRSHFDMVRCGIAVYGMDPFHEDPFARELQPALTLRSYLAEVKRLAAGESTGYGRRFRAARDTHVGVVPIGYGDGWRRGLSGNADVLIDGRRHPQVGTVSMDSITVDLGPDPAAESLRGQEVVLVGAQGSQRILAEEVARRLGTINYEIGCGLTARVARVYERDGAPVSGSPA